MRLDPIMMLAAMVVTLAVLVWAWVHAAQMDDIDLALDEHLEARARAQRRTADADAEEVASEERVA